MGRLRETDATVSKKPDITACIRVSPTGKSSQTVRS